MIALVAQIAIFLMLIETILLCMPRAWRRASQANRLRQMARVHSIAVGLNVKPISACGWSWPQPLMLIFLTGNALYQTRRQDHRAGSHTCAATSRPRISIASTISSTPSHPIDCHLHSSNDTQPTMARFISVAVAAWTLIVAPRKFAAGVRERSAEYRQFDITRSTGLADAPNSSASASNQNTDVA